MLKIKKSKQAHQQFLDAETILQIDLSDSEVLLIEVVGEDSEALDIRKWYSTAHGFMPGKGVRIPRRKFKKFLMGIAIAEGRLKAAAGR